MAGRKPQTPMNTILEHLKKSGNVRNTARHFGVTKQAIYERLRRIKYPEYTVHNSPYYKRNKVWSAPEEEYLLENYLKAKKTRTMPELAKTLKCSDRQLKDKYYRLRNNRERTVLENQ